MPSPMGEENVNKARLIGMCKTAELFICSEKINTLATKILTNM
jgi:hypothetical protein